MSTPVVFAVAIDTKQPQSALKPTLLHTSVIETGFSNGMYWVKTDDGRTWRYNVDQIAAIVEDRSK